MKKPKADRQTADQLRASRGVTAATTLATLKEETPIARRDFVAASGNYAAMKGRVDKFIVALHPDGQGLAIDDAYLTKFDDFLLPGFPEPSEGMMEAYFNWYLSTAKGRDSKGKFVAGKPITYMTLLHEKRIFLAALADERPKGITAETRETAQWLIDEIKVKHDLRDHPPDRDVQLTMESVHAMLRHCWHADFQVAAEQRITTHLSILLFVVTGGRSSSFLRVPLRSSSSSIPGDAVRNSDRTGAKNGDMDLTAVQCSYGVDLVMYLSPRHAKTVTSSKQRFPFVLAETIGTLAPLVFLLQLVVHGHVPLAVAADVLNPAHLDEHGRRQLYVGGVAAMHPVLPGSATSDKAMTNATINRRFKELSLLSGFEHYVRTRDFRHGRAYFLWESGASKEQIGNVLGHEVDSPTTDTYLRSNQPFVNVWDDSAGATKRTGQSTRLGAVPDPHAPKKLSEEARAKSRAKALKSDKVVALTEKIVNLKRNGPDLPDSAPESHTKRARAASPGAETSNVPAPNEAAAIRNARAGIARELQREEARVLESTRKDYFRLMAQGRSVPSDTRPRPREAKRAKAHDLLAEAFSLLEKPSSEWSTALPPLVALLEQLRDAGVYVHEDIRSDDEDSDGEDPDQEESDDAEATTTTNEATA